MYLLFAIISFLEIFLQFYSINIIYSITEIKNTKEKLLTAFIDSRKAINLKEKFFQRKE
jgi:hypothetical protein